MCKKERGFTLIELMIAVAVIAILIGLAYPAYDRYGFRARRADGKELIMRIAAAEERFYTTFNRYTNDPNDLGMGVPPVKSEKGYYSVTISVPAEGSTVQQSYSLAAVPQDSQATDKCGTLKYTNSGVKKQTGNENNGACW